MNDFTELTKGEKDTKNLETCYKSDKRGSSRLRKTLEADVRERKPESGGNVTRSSPQQRRHTPSISRGVSGNKWSERVRGGWVIHSRDRNVDGLKASGEVVRLWEKKSSEKVEEWAVFRCKRCSERVMSQEINDKRAASSITALQRNQFFERRELYNLWGC